MKKMYLLLISSIALLILSVSLVFAILIDNKEKGPIRLNIGKLDFSVSGSLKEMDYIYSGYDIVEDKFKIVNNSTIKVDIRIKLEFHFDSDVLTITELNNLLENDSVHTLQGFTLESDGYYHMTLNPGSQDIILIDELIFDGNFIKSNYSGKSFKIRLVFNAKQHEHAEFTDFGDVWFK